MGIPLKQSTASQEIPLGQFVDSTDGNTEETALTIANTDIKIWKNGATTLANKNSGGGTHISNGIYYAVLDATDTDTVGPMVIFVHVAGALAVRLECDVLPANVFDARYGTDYLQVDVANWNNAALSTPAVSGQPVVTLGAAQAAYAPAKAGDAMAVSDKTGFSLVADQAVNCTKWNGHAVLEVVSGSPVVTLGAVQAAYAPAKAGDAMTLAADQAVNCTKWNGHAVLEVVSGSPVVTLGAIQAAYAPAKAGDAMAVSDKTGFSLAADQAVNATKIGGVTQTGRDLGASVLLSPGTGAGQIALSSGQVTVGTNNDKAGYTASTVSDKTGYSLAADQAVNCTKWNGHAVLEVVSGSPVVTLGAAQAAYAPAKAGDAMTLTYGAPPSATAIRTEMDSNSTKLANLDASITSRLASASYTAPPAASAIRSEIDSNSTQLSAIKAKTDNLPASPAAVGSAMTLAADQAVNCTKWNGHAVLEVVSGSPVVTLGAVQAAYAPSKAGEAMTLTSGERGAIADAICDESASGHTGFLASFIDASISSRLASASYTAPDNSGIATIKAKTDVMPVVWVG